MAKIGLVVVDRRACSEHARRRSRRSFARPFASSLGQAAIARLRGGMSSAPTADEIARDATWLAQALDPSQGAARLVAMDRESYRAASFLDDRMLATAGRCADRVVDCHRGGRQRRHAVRCSLDFPHRPRRLDARFAAARRARWRARNPRAASAPRPRAELLPRYVSAISAPVPKLMSRTFAEAEVACVKATSFASEIAPELVPAERARAVHVRDPAQLYREHPCRREQRRGTARCSLAAAPSG